jgi:8-oxo-dGTP pyrophosphatase MutT (NUDIX family)
MIRRKNTLGYMDFMRGKFPSSNKKYIMNLINEMTLEEKADLLAKPYAELFQALWKTDLTDTFARDKFDELKGSGELAELVAASKTRWVEQEWGFPKGRRNNQESELSSALREYQEETGYDSSKLVLIENLVPYEEIFIGSNYKAYKHKYYVAVGRPTKLANFQESEVSALAWFPFEEAVVKIRPYDIERIALLKQVHTMISTIYK